MDAKPKLDSKLVEEFVRISHSDLERVKELLAKEPALVNAAWDWGGGDWETGLGASAHMGRKDIAICLLENGARIDLFAAAMLGKLDMVKAVLSVFPEVIQVPGPHGISLLAHGLAGGEDARAVADYLNTFKVPNR